MTMTEDSLDNAVHEYVERLCEFEARCGQHTILDLCAFNELTMCTQDMLHVCGDFAKQHNAQEIEHARARFHEATNHWFSQSYFYHRTRVWPRGYAGDFETLEAIYQGYPLKRTGIGLYLDSHFLSRRIVVAARGRRAKIVETLAVELQSRTGVTRILNIACGSCRELCEMPKELDARLHEITCIDTDQDALNYARTLLMCNAISVDNIKFLKHNALRLVNLSKSMARFGAQDIIYSTGLFDYVADTALVSMISTLYSMLREGGKLIAPFKDMLAYDPLEGHWLSNWSAFLQRSEEDIDAVFRCAGIPASHIQKSRDRTGTMVFYTVNQ